MPTNQSQEQTPEVTESRLNLQAEFGCILLNKELEAIMQKKGSQTIYAILPRIDPNKEDEGMEFGEAVGQIGEFVQGLMKMKENPIPKEKIQDLLSAVLSQPDKVRLQMRQAYLFVRTGETEKTCEYAFNITVKYDPDEQEQNEGVLFRISKLAFTVWSCDKKIILDQMDLYDLDNIDAVLAGQMNAALPQTETPQIEAH